ncbi:MAG TPA: hypothetical protein HPP56_07410 [Nitrospirae bacterium]|nr:hypothetical protein [Nitrospirota bacterium]
MLKFPKISFIRCRIKIPHQPFLLDLIKFSVLSLILGHYYYTLSHLTLYKTIYG